MTYDIAEADRLLGDFAHARVLAAQVPVDRDDVSFVAACNAALSGDTAYTQKVMEDEKRAAPTSTLVRKVWLPLRLSVI